MPKKARDRPAGRARPSSEQLLESFAALVGFSPASPTVGLDLQDAFEIFAEVVWAASDIRSAWEDDQRAVEAEELINALGNRLIRATMRRRAALVAAVEEAARALDRPQTINRFVHQAGSLDRAFVGGPSASGEWQLGLNPARVAEELAKVGELSASRVAARLSVSVGAFGDQAVDASWNSFRDAVRKKKR